VDELVVVRQYTSEDCCCAVVIEVPEVRACIDADVAHKSAAVSMPKVQPEGTVNVGMTGEAPTASVNAAPPDVLHA
jgi:hypothetical protein